jgi:hypothetical protein
MTDATPAPPPPGYRDVSIPMSQIGLPALLGMFPLIGLPLIPYWLLHGWDAFWAGAFGDGLLLIVGFIGGIILHEAVHAIGWKYAGGLGWNEFKFGIDLKSLSPYCHARAPMSARAYRIGALLPSLVTGVLPVAVGTALANPTLAFVGAVLFSAAIGDFMILWIIRNVRQDALLLDHPTQAGCYVQDV